MTNKHRIKIPDSELKILFAKSGNLCAFPECNNPVIAEEGDSQKTLAEMAHIIAYEDKGPRSDSTLSKIERNKANNLILFCPTHHKLVDSFPAQYPVRLLQEWKRNHEKSIKEKVSQSNTTDRKAQAIPFLPQPFYAHPYLLQSNFTGRNSERTMLSNWITKGNNPILTLVAHGGMGKSSVAWYWLKNDINHEPLKGIMWWSFYEGDSSFYNFLDEAIIYFSNKQVMPTSLTSTNDKVRELVNLLQQQKVLLVLDGFERQLRVYASLDAVYQSDEMQEESLDERACINPITAQFLRNLLACAAKARVLITTRLKVHDLEDRNGDPLEGCQIEELKGLHKDDAVAFMRVQGVTKGDDGRIADVCETYGNHPLSLRLLSGFIKKDKRKPGDISIAPEYHSTIHAKLKARQHHVLEVSYNALSEDERILLSSMAAFRSPMPYEALTIFNKFDNDRKFNAVIDEMIERGLVFHDSRYNKYDLHPIVRQYAYDRLSDKIGTHTVLADYFSSIPAPQLKKAQSLEDMSLTIEIYHHTLSAGRYNDAIKLYVDRLNTPLSEIGAYQHIIGLLSPLLDRGEDHDRERAKKRILHPLAKAYAMSGDTKMAVKHYESEVKVRKTEGELRVAAITLRNLSDLKIALGDLLSAENDLREGIKLCKESGEDGLERGLHRKLGILLTYEGRGEEARKEMSYLPSKFRSARQSDIGPLGELSLYALVTNDLENALRDAAYMRKLAEKFTRESDIIFAEWLLGIIHFHMKDLPKSQYHLNEAIVRCRRVKLVELEPDILLAYARWYYAKHNATEACSCAEKALEIADRREYRLKQADIHNFLAQLALDSGDYEAARKHAKTAFECAWCDAPPNCYKFAMDEAEKLLHMETKERSLA